jgi:hypothetical protein
VYYLIWVRRQARATTRELGAAMTIGTVIAAGAIGFPLL